MAGNKYIKIDSTTGDLTEAPGDNTAATANAIVALDGSGTITPVQMPGGAPVNATAGVGDAGKIIKTDTSGKLDSSFLPAGVGEDSISVVVGADVSAGDFVHIYESTGAKVRPADNTTPYVAHGFVLDTVAATGSVTVYFEGLNDQLTGLTVGTQYFLHTNGDAAPYSTITKTAGDIAQKLGVAVNSTSIAFENTNPVVYA